MILRRDGFDSLVVESAAAAAVAAFSQRQVQLGHLLRELLGDTGGQRRRRHSQRHVKHVGILPVLARDVALVGPPLDGLLESLEAPLRRKQVGILDLAAGRVIHDGRQVCIRMGRGAGEGRNGRDSAVDEVGR